MRSLWAALLWVGVISGAGAADRWIGAWGAAPYGPYPISTLSQPETEAANLPLPLFDGNDASNQSFRMIVHPTIGGSRVRVRLSNLMGTAPLTIDGVRVAKPVLGIAPAIVPSTDRAVTWSGGADVIVIAPGREAMSDPVDYTFAGGDDVAISFHVVGKSASMTWHALALHLSWVGLPGGGNTTSDPTGLTFPQFANEWYFLSGLDVARDDALGTIVALGDSITDGAHALPQTNTRWPDALGRRLQAAGIAMGVLNEGIHGNQVVGGPLDGTGGPNAVSRFSRDVLSRPGVRSVFVLEGTNDLGNERLNADAIYAGLQTLAAEAHAHDVCIVVSTVLPRGTLVDQIANNWTKEREAQRVKLNALILASPDFDAVSDLSTVMQNPLIPSQGNPLYFFPDGLHPSSIGMQVIADHIDVADLAPPPVGRCARQPSAAAKPWPLPRNFLWGVSSSAFQSEGGDVDANWNRYNAADPDQDPYGLSVDFRHRFRGDVALAAKLGVNTYRIGINWARLEPREGEFDTRELAYYDRLIATIRAAGITPLITLDHWAYPGWVLDQGGWYNPKTVDDFARYVRRVARRYHDDTHLWLTFNEAVFYLISEVKGRVTDPLGQFRLAAVDPRAALMMNNIVKAHRQSYDIIHRFDAHAMVSSNIVWMGNNVLAATAQKATDLLFLDRTVDKMDYIAFDYYYGDALTAIASGATWKADPDPAGMYTALKKLAKRYPDKPLMVSENGLSTENGAARTDGNTRETVLRDTVYYLQKAHAEGVNVIGYFYWSLTDNFEWGSYTARFGLYTVDVLTDPTLARRPTAAVPAYRRIIRERGLPADYLPVDTD